MASDLVQSSRYAEPIAIIGMGCRFPGGVRGPESFWRLLLDQVDTITEIPASRFDVEALYNSQPATPGRIMTRWGGFLDDLDRFDAGFFGISPREADRLDPQQRLLMEVSWDALEDADQVPGSSALVDTGVFIGVWLQDYESHLFKDLDLLDFHMTTGSGRYSLAGRLSYQFGFQGPSMTVDTACSSSLVAVHLACQSLQNGECGLALAGGVNVILQPHITVAYSQSRMMAPDGRCKFGDARADGYVRSDGAGIIVLKRLSEAVAAGDPIYATIRGSAVNNDGRSSGYLTTPGTGGQEDLLRKAYRAAGISPGKVQYIEAHGTGTRAGDPVELQALGAVLSEGRAAGQICQVGSVKTNLGHTEGAAGIAGLIKVALSLKHKILPASLHFEEPNPHIPWEQIPLRVQAEQTSWPSHEGPAVAGVSAFGIAGTNAHVVVQEAPCQITETNIPGALPATPLQVMETGNAHLLPLSARSPEALKDLAQAYHRLIESGDAPALADICYTAGVRRAHHEYRQAFAASSIAELSKQLAAFVQNQSHVPDVPPVSQTEPKVLFVFPGQGSQWVGMGRQLLKREPVFREMMARCGRALRPYSNWSLLEELQVPEESARLDEIDVIQPALFAIQVSLAALWRSWGLEPDGVVGHSLGEVAAACTAGALDLEDGARIICQRSQLMKQISGQGAMAVVDLTVPEAQEALAGYEDRLSIAVSNSPRSTVLSGCPVALHEVTDALQARGIFCRNVKVDVAAHSPQMEPLKPLLLASLAGLQPSPTAMSIYSTVTGQLHPGEAFDAEYWGDNLRQPVLFATSAQAALGDGYNIFIEISPHPVLIPAIEQNFTSQPGPETPARIALPSCRRNEDERTAMLESLGHLYTWGYPVDWSRLYPNGGQCVSLPLYPWQRERFWLDNIPGLMDAGEEHLVRHGPRVHPLLGWQLSLAEDGGRFIWENELAQATLPFLFEHRLDGAAVLPASAYLEMVLAAADVVFGSPPYGLNNVVFQHPLVLHSDGAAPLVQICLSPARQGFTFHIHSRQSENWVLHARGQVRHAPELHPARSTSQEQIGPGAPEGESLEGEAFYQQLADRGIYLGGPLRYMKHIWRDHAGVLATLDVNSVHPHQLLSLESCFHLGPLIGQPEPEGCDSHVYLPERIAELRVYQVTSGQAWRHARLQAGIEANSETLEGDLLLLGEDEQVMVEALGLRLQRQDRNTHRALQQDFGDWLYTVQWERKERPHRDQTATPLPLDQTGSWLIFADDSGVGQKLASLLERRGASCILVSPGEGYQRVKPGHWQLDPAHPEAFRKLLEDVLGPDRHPCRGIIYLWGVETAPPDENVPITLDAAQSMGCDSVLYLVQALAGVDLTSSPRLWLVTRGVHVVEEGIESVSVAQSPLWGLGRVIAYEHPKLRSTLVDLSLSGAGEVEFLFQELWSDDHENQIVLRGDARYVARLAHCEPNAKEEKRRAVSGDHPFRLEISTPGNLDELTLRTSVRQKPGPGEIEIRVHAAGLNFSDVMRAMDIYPGLADATIPLGIECAGQVTALGEDVVAFQVGDEVLAIAPLGIGTFVTVSTDLVVPKPAHLSCEEAATIPIAFLTAYYALDHLARLRRGERLLIHSASGGVGLAAVQLAQRVGAEIFATAGNPERREFLRSLGIQHVMDSRSLTFADEVMARTGGEGVDVVLNSLTGEAIPKGLSILRPCGRFLELGKRDIYQNSQLSLGSFQSNLSFSSIDLDQMVREHPGLIRSLFQELMQGFEDRSLQPLPRTVFPISEAANAFRLMAQAKHIGKIVLSLQVQEVLVAPSAEESRTFHPHATYLISGGLGGLGLEMAQWMVKQGAQHLVLMGRRGASAAAQEVLHAMEQGGAEIVVAQADVSQKQQVAGVLAEIGRSMPPLRGIIHAAGILDDGMLLQLNPARLQSVMAPKILGAWNLHSLTLDEPLDFFVLFSSTASMLGSPGQGNYSAANAFLDALAHQRRLQNRPALSINWGPWSEVGLAAVQANRGERLTLRGLESIAPHQGLNVLAQLLQLDTAQIGVMRFDFHQWREFYPAVAGSPLFALFTQTEDVHSPHPDKGTEKGSQIREALLAVEPGHQRRSLLEAHLRDQVAQVLRLSAARLDARKPLGDFGLDSLMGLELRNRLEVSLQVTLPATFVWNYPTLQELVTYLADRMNIPLEAAEQMAPPDAQVESAAPPDDRTLDELIVNIDALSDEGALQALLKK